LEDALDVDNPRSERALNFGLIVDFPNVIRSSGAPNDSNGIDLQAIFEKAEFTCGLSYPRHLDDVFVRYARERDDLRSNRFAGIDELVKRLNDGSLVGVEAHSANLNDLRARLVHFKINGDKSHEISLSEFRLIHTRACDD
jgi:hypothetical protein